jgi:hypothetical protein
VIKQRRLGTNDTKPLHVVAHSERNHLAHEATGSQPPDRRQREVPGRYIDVIHGLKNQLQRRPFGTDSIVDKGRRFNCATTIVNEFIRRPVRLSG